MLFNIHKLAALAGVVVTVIRISPIFSGGNFTGWIWVVLVAAGLSVILLFATGALMSIREEEPGIARFLHQAGPMVLILCLAGMYFRY